MKSLIKSYIETLTIDKINNFAIKNNIYLNNEQLLYILNLLQNNYDDIIVNEEKYLILLKQNLDDENFKKIKDLFYLYKNKYLGYLI